VKHVKYSFGTVRRLWDWYEFACVVYCSNINEVKNPSLSQTIIHIKGLAPTFSVEYYVILESNICAFLHADEYFYDVLKCMHFIIFVFNGSTALVGPASFQFPDLFTSGRTPWAGDQLVARPLPKHRTAQTQNKHTYVPKHLCPKWDSNARSQRPSERRQIS
jgi:hypothetical protein